MECALIHLVRAHYKCTLSKCNWMSQNFSELMFLSYESSVSVVWKQCGPWFRYKQHSVIPLLLSHGAKISDVDTRSGCTALHYVLQYPGVISCHLLTFCVVLLFMYWCVCIVIFVLPQSITCTLSHIIWSQHWAVSLLCSDTQVRWAYHRYRKPYLVRWAYNCYRKPCL